MDTGVVVVVEPVKFIIGLKVLLFVGCCPNVTPVWFVEVAAPIGLNCTPPADDVLVPPVNVVCGLKVFVFPVVFRVSGLNYVCCCPPPLGLKLICGCGL